MKLELKIPIVFKGSNFITIKLVSSDLEQIREQMKNRQEGGLIDYELQKKTNDKNLKRKPLINEVEIDVAGKTIEEVLNEAIGIYRRDYYETVHCRCILK